MPFSSFWHLTPTPASVWSFLPALIFSWQKREWIAKKPSVFFLQLIVSNSVDICTKWMTGIMTWTCFSSSLKGFSCGKCIDIRWALSNSGKLVLGYVLVRRLKKNEITEKTNEHNDSNKQTNKQKNSHDLKWLSFRVVWFPTSGLEFLDRVNTVKLIILYKKNRTVLLHPSCFCWVNEIQDFKPYIQLKY